MSQGWEYWVNVSSSRLLPQGAGGLCLPHKHPAQPAEHTVSSPAALHHCGANNAPNTTTLMCSLTVSGNTSNFLTQFWSLYIHSVMYTAGVWDEKALVQRN